MTAQPIASDAAKQAALTALGTTVLAVELELAIQQAVILAALNI